MARLQWVAIDLLTGSILCDFPKLFVQDPFKRTVGRYETQGAALLVDDKTNPAWLDATRPGYGALIGYRNVTDAQGNITPVIEWGGVITKRQRNRTNVVSLSLATPEAYLDRRYAGDYSVTNRDQNLICTDLIAQFAADVGGMPFTTSVVGAAGTLRTQTNYDKQDTTVYARLQQAMGVTGGPEFSGHWVWTHGPERIQPVVYVGSRIGTAVLPGLNPAAVFASGMLVDATFDEDYSSQSGANVVTALGPGQGAARPQAVAVPTDYEGRPKFEYRWSPANQATDITQLQSYAGQALKYLAEGSQALSLTASVATAPKLGVDWNLGDDIGFELTGPAYPTPIKGVGRAIGYEVDDTTVKPILSVPNGVG